ncbi:MAG: methylmalonyl-CoA mutase family protein [Thermodesulfobacteriota bacterium]
MSAKLDIKRIEEERIKWEKKCVNPVLEKMGERESNFSTSSIDNVRRVYTPEDIKNLDYLDALNFPGQYPFTRGIRPTGYRGQLWTHRLVSGAMGGKESNKILKNLIAHGETGLNPVFDPPTLNIRDSDEEMSQGQVGVNGTAIDTLRDMENLFDEIDIEKVSVSLITPHPFLFPMYIAMAENRGVELHKLRGTIQNDCINNSHSCNWFRMAPLPLRMKIHGDAVEFATKHLPLWNPLSIVGYHIREGGATAAQEIGFTIADGIAYVKDFIERGMDVDLFAPRLSFFFSCETDFLEEVAKFRAARRVWAKIMKNRFHAKEDTSLLLRYHVQTAGSSLLAQQPLNNIIRTTIQALAAVLGGCNSLHTNSYDEAFGAPTPEAALIALRTQQIIAHESGVANTVDPLGGSYCIEAITDELERKSFEIIEQVDQRGGAVNAWKWIQDTYLSAAYEKQKRIENKKQVIVGLNAFTLDEQKEHKLDLFEIDPDFEEKQIAFLHEIKRKRDHKSLERALNEITHVTENGHNTMRPMVEAYKALATLGEVRLAWERGINIVT